uniref:Zgc:113274 n=1 Tax=Paramormyrops kingsleyae TaxID=1676925 RepID=A0A3B3SH25_9TELE
MEMERAAVDVTRGKSIRSVAKDKNIGRSTLTVGYSGTAEAKRIFTDEVEEELVDHIKKLADQFHSLTPKKCCELANRNNIPNFMAGHHLSCRIPEAPSLGRTTAFIELMVGYNYIGLVESLEGNEVSTVVHAFISSCLDFANSLSIASPQTSFSRLLLVQNSAAGPLTGTRNREQITTVQASLH